MPFELLRQVLAILLKTRLLVGATESDLSETSELSTYRGYKNKKSKVNINVPLKMEVKVRSTSMCPSRWKRR